MKILVYFLTLTIATAMVLYNHRAYISINDLVEQLDLISTQLEQRGRQRYVLQKHLTVVQSTKEYTQKQLAEVIESKVFDTINREKLSEATYPGVIDWKKSKQIREYFFKLIEQFPIQNQDEIIAFNTFNIEDWTNRMVDSLDYFQQEDISLANGLNQLMISRLAKIVSVNVILVACLFLTFLIFNYKKSKADIANKNRLNESLLSRELALKSSKNVLISLMEDLSQEKNSAINLTQEFENLNNRLRLKNKDMEQFIYTISHDLKAPLVTIGGFSKQLQQQLANQLNEEQTHKFNRIKENLAEMQKLLSNLLDISRVMTQELEKSALDIKELILSQLKSLESLIEESDANIIIKEPLLEIYANPTLVGICIANLISNAIKHRNRNQQLMIEIATETTTNGIRLSIKDNGVGIQEKDHQKIFKVFEKDSESQGSGVGLAIVKAVIEKHDGFIDLTSTPGKGSTFSLIFPFAEE